MTQDYKPLVGAFSAFAKHSIGQLVTEDAFGAPPKPDVVFQVESPFKPPVAISSFGAPPRAALSLAPLKDLTLVDMMLSKERQAKADRVAAIHAEQAEAIRKDRAEREASRIKLRQQRMNELADGIKRMNFEAQDPYRVNGVLRTGDNWIEDGYGGMFRVDPQRPGEYPNEYMNRVEAARWKHQGGGETKPGGLRSVDQGRRQFPEVQSTASINEFIARKVNEEFPDLPAIPLSATVVPADIPPTVSVTQDPADLNIKSRIPRIIDTPVDASVKIEPRPGDVEAAATETNTTWDGPAQLPQHTDVPVEIYAEAEKVNEPVKAGTRSRVKKPKP